MSGGPRRDEQVILAGQDCPNRRVEAIIESARPVDQDRDMLTVDALDVVGGIGRQGQRAPRGITRLDSIVEDLPVRVEPPQEVAPASEPPDLVPDADGQLPGDRGAERTRDRREAPERRHRQGRRIPAASKCGRGPPVGEGFEAGAPQPLERA